MLSQLKLQQKGSFTGALQTHCVVFGFDEPGVECGVHGLPHWAPQLLMASFTQMLSQELLQQKGSLTAPKHTHWRMLRSLTPGVKRGTHALASDRHMGPQPSPGLTLPSSQSSPGSFTPLPQRPGFQQFEFVASEAQVASQFVVQHDGLWSHTHCCTGVAPQPRLAVDWWATQHFQSSRFVAPKPVTTTGALRRVVVPSPS